VRPTQVEPNAVLHAASQEFTAWESDLVRVVGLPAVYRNADALGHPTRIRPHARRPNVRHGVLAAYSGQGG
jgi:hypothetical protein